MAWLGGAARAGRSRHQLASPAAFCLKSQDEVADLLPLLLNLGGREPVLHLHGDGEAGYGVLQKWETNQVIKL